MGIKVETAGFRRWVEVQVHEGKDRGGKMFGPQAFRNVITGQTVVPPEGWDGDLSKLDHGDMACVITASDKYRAGYEKINWHTAPQKQS